MKTPQTPASSSITLQGIAVSPGIFIAKGFFFDPVQAVLPNRHIHPGEIDRQNQLLDEAIVKTKEEIKQLRAKVSKTLDEAHASIFDPQLMILDDPLVIGRTRELISNENMTAGAAFMSIIQKFADQFAALGDAYIASRNADILDVGTRVCRHLGNIKPNARELEFDEDVIILSPDLSPSDTAQMDHTHVKGMATELGGPTSHTAILAKALEIPAVVGLSNFLKHYQTDSLVIIDGYDGTVTINPDSREIARARARKRRHITHERDLKKLKDMSAETIDGFQVELSANVELPIEIPHVVAHGAQGVGLFRTEFQYLEGDSLPDEETLYKVYHKVLADVAPAPVIFRTIDLGGDKIFKHLHDGRTEMNPFLGLRAIRLCLAYPEIFRTQLRALLRASVAGNARMMFPMISGLGELRQAKTILAEEQRKLKKAKIPFNAQMQIGCMIEIPSAALVAGQLAREVDFFSIGTNDLIQYTLAVDRGNEQVASLYDPFHPAILDLLRMTIEAAQREGIWVGVCGEMSSDPLCALMLVGLGINELSMGALAIPEIKRLIRQIRLADAQKIVEEIYSLKSSEEVHQYVREAYRVLQRRRRRKLE